MCVKEWMKRICPCFTPSRIALAESARETIIFPRLGKLSTRFFFFKVRARDCTTFTLHDLADFYVESVTAHRIKRNDHSCFHNRWPKSKTKLKLKTSLRARGPPGVSGALRSLRILRIGRIGSGPRDCSQPPWMWPQEENCCQIEETDNTNGNQRAQNNFQRD